MYFDSFADFVAMGRHGLYVWMSYGFFLVILIWNLLLPVLASRRARERAVHYWARQSNPAGVIEVTDATH